MKLIVNHNRHDIVLLLTTRELTPFPENASGRGAAMLFARKMREVLQGYVDDDRRHSVDRDNIKLYLDLFAKLEKEATFLWSCEYEAKTNARLLADADKPRTL
jgi:hypothetical protein